MASKWGFYDYPGAYGRLLAFGDPLGILLGDSATQSVAYSSKRTFLLTTYLTTYLTT
ncbi:uncharacterized protein FFB20_10280 [Fusarium fujikuroi]|nr:uncharacterized protein FFE2_03102 [Fusarium fujikuroi]SCN87829.1 uncharacterized protein FFM5_04165 [Fusarium fujikuroi]SCN97034.1 uncharacterized protein FFB20_10280 [Fusarium fujikuroi]SCO05374.1 uncharacterized protein FFC1_09977 [Fusarium fujikuroi]SCO37478.1 uncharacterized protein FFMR_04686 [Fusarium fujikuroi]